MTTMVVVWSHDNLTTMMMIVLHHNLTVHNNDGDGAPWRLFFIFKEGAGLVSQLGV